MRKILLVVLIGMVLAFDVCGIIKELIVDKEQEIDHISETTTIVYTE